MGFSYYSILPFITAILLALSFPEYDKSFLIWVAFIPLFFYVAGAQSGKRAWWGSCAAGLVFFGITMRWFFDTWPLNWAGISSDAWGFIIISAVWTLSIVLMAGLFGLFGRFAYALKTNWASGFGIAALFAFLEYARSWLFIVPWIGEQTTLGPHWSFAALGYTLHNQPFALSLAPWLGLYGLTFLIVVANWNIFLFLKNPRVMSAPITIAAIVAFSFIPWPEAAAVGEKKLALIQTDFPALVGYGLSDPGPVETELVTTALARDPTIEIIIFPEGSGWLASLSDDFTKPLEEAARAILGEKDYLVIDHARIQEGEAFTSQLLYFVNGKGIVARHDKTLLVPGGEYLPYSIKSVARLLNNDDFVGSFELARGLIPGTRVEPALAHDTYIGGLICSGVVSPALNSTMTQKGAHMLLSVSSDAIFGSSQTLIAMERAMAKLHAAQNQRYFVQVANGGLSYIIDERGALRVTTEKLEHTVLIGSAALFEHKSFYTRFGSVFPFIFLILSLILYGRTARTS